MIAQHFIFLLHAFEFQFKKNKKPKNPQPTPHVSLEILRPILRRGWRRLLALKAMHFLALDEVSLSFSLPLSHSGMLPFTRPDSDFVHTGFILT